MSQWGTQYWAEEGKDWQWMLHYYYDPIGLGGVEPGWPAGKNNICRSPGDGFMDFEGGMDGQKIESTVPGMEFITSEGLDWVYADIRTGEYNVYPYGHQGYECNGNFFAWLGPTGDWGRINFTQGTATYLSVLVSTSSGVKLDAYDADDSFLATSGWAENNLDTRTFTRLTVEAQGMAYVIVHDTGNYWLIDDICTDAPSGLCSMDVPYLNQCDDPWRNLPYNHIAGTICDWGCALTSTAMVLNYYGEPYGLETDPEELNEWLKHHFWDVNGNGKLDSGEPTGYTRHGDLNWKLAAEYFNNVYGEGVVSYNGRRDFDEDKETYTDFRRDSDSILNSDLASQRPAILKVPYAPWHFIVATGKTKVDDTITWTINDPGWRSKKNLLDSYSNEYFGMRRYGPRSEDDSAIIIEAYSPVEIHVIDPQGRRLGKDPNTGEEFDEIPNGGYYTDTSMIDGSEIKALEILKPIDGNYTIKAIGTDAGSYDVDCYSYDKSGEWSDFNTFTGEITPGETQEHEVSYSSTPLPNLPPIADANGPYEGYVGLSITFSSVDSYDPDGTIVSYEWDLDDDGEFDDATGSNPSKTWDATYSGNISLKVTDNDGATGIGTTTLIVAPPVSALVPTLKPIGMTILVGLLAIIAISRIRRRAN